MLAGLEGPAARGGGARGGVAANVRGPEPRVEGQGRGEGLGYRIRALREAAAPGLACARTASGRGHEASASPRRAPTGRPPSSSAGVWVIVRRGMFSRAAGGARGRAGGAPARGGERVGVAERNGPPPPSRARESRP